MIDLELQKAMDLEADRQVHNIELIASENYVSKDVLKAAGSILTNKYAEGYPGRRYYGGCEFVDMAENLAIQRLKEIYGCEHANVQPHSGSQANMAVYMSILKPGDKVLGMDLAAGGHLTHGHPLNFSGTLYNFIAYGVDKDSEEIDYEALETIARREQPKLIVAGASAYSKIIDFARIGKIAKKIGAYYMVDMAHIAGLVAAGLHPSPIPHADFVTSTTHKTLRGPRGGIILCKAKFAKGLDRNVFPGMQGGPLMHIIAAKAVCFYEALQPAFKVYQQQVLKNMKVLEIVLRDEGFRIVANGSENHLLLVDVKTAFGLSGKACEKALDMAGITCNKNSIPFDEEKPLITSGIRVGSAAMTSRGFKEKEFAMVGKWIARAIKNITNEKELKKIREEVYALSEQYPIVREE
ncbi:MAG: serine hydroxymethyltransferase [Breznakia sp.]